MNLADYGARSWPTVTEGPVNDHGEHACPVDRITVEHTHGEVEIPVVHLVDDQLRERLEEIGTETVRSRGWVCDDHDLVFPETVSGTEAHGYSSRMVGVEVEARGGTLWVPVRSDDLPDAPLAALERQPTRVGHCRKDDTDVYIGRHGPNGQNHLLNTEIGETGWLGNPYPAEVFGREECVGMFTHALLVELENRPELRRAVHDLRGQVLGCWCQELEEDGPLCHGEVIAAVADRVICKRGGDGD